MHIIYTLPSWALVVGLLVLMFAGNEMGYRFALARRDKESDRAHGISVGLKASILGLVALLLGFSYAMTSSRYGERSHMVLDEANAIGTCYLRAGLLAEPARGRIRTVLRQYTDLRLEYFDKALDPAEAKRTIQAMDAAMVELWAGVEAAVAADQTLARTSQIVPAANAVIDLSATRSWASRNQMPGSVFLLLGVCIVISSMLTGHSSGQVGRRHLGLWIALNLLLMSVTYVMLDFDRPRRGLITVNHGPLIELRGMMGPGREN